MPESVSAVAVERLVDGILICGMLFGGLALGSATGVDADRIGDVRAIGRSMLVVFALGLGVLLLAARSPGGAQALVRRMAAPLGAKVSSRLEELTRRISSGAAGILALPRAFPFLVWS